MCLYGSLLSIARRVVKKREADRQLLESHFGKPAGGHIQATVQPINPGGGQDLPGSNPAGGALCEPPAAKTKLSTPIFQKARILSSNGEASDTKMV
jgi:hypothetical protein